MKHRNLGRIGPRDARASARDSLPPLLDALLAMRTRGEMRSLLAEQSAVCMDGLAMRRVHPARRLGGWELKCYALLHSAFAEVLLLDADNCPVRNPDFNPAKYHPEDEGMGKERGEGKAKVTPTAKPSTR